MSGPFRKEYRPLVPSEMEHLDKLKSKAEELYDLLVIPGNRTRELSGGGGRELALAKTNLEQAVMWAVKAITG